MLRSLLDRLEVVTVLSPIARCYDCKQWFLRMPFICWNLCREDRVKRRLI